MIISCFWWLHLDINYFCFFLRNVLIYFGLIHIIIENKSNQLNAPNRLPNVIIYFKKKRSLNVAVD